MVGPAYRSEEASFRATLRGRAGYAGDTAQGSLATYQPTLLSVPQSISSSPYAEDIVGPGARGYLEMVERMVRPMDQVHDIGAQYGPVKPYVCPVMCNRMRH